MARYIPYDGSWTGREPTLRIIVRLDRNRDDAPQAAFGGTRMYGVRKRSNG